MYNPVRRKPVRRHIIHKPRRLRPNQKWHLMSVTAGTLIHVEFDAVIVGHSSSGVRVIDSLGHRITLPHYLNSNREFRIVVNRKVC